MLTEFELYEDVTYSNIKLMKNKSIKVYLFTSVFKILFILDTIVNKEVQILIDYNF